jgi:preprotein translocase subunit SecG
MSLVRNRKKGATLMRTVIAAFLCSAVLVSPVAAADSSGAMNGGDLQDICTSSSAEAKAACRFYILGVTQGITMGMSIADGKTHGGRPCIPDDTPGSALELAVKTKLGQDLMVYPEDKKLEASGLIGGILVSTFPCRKAP